MNTYRYFLLAAVTSVMVTCGPAMAVTQIEDTYIYAYQNGVSPRGSHLGVWFIARATAVDIESGVTFSIQERDPEGNYWIAVGPSKVPVVVEDAPFRVEALLHDPPRLKLDDGHEEPIAGALELAMTREHRLYATVKGGVYRALLSRNAHHQIWDALDEDARGAFLLLGGERIPVNLKT